MSAAAETVAFRPTGQILAFDGHLSQAKLDRSDMWYILRKQTHKIVKPLRCHSPPVILNQHHGRIAMMDPISILVMLTAAKLSRRVAKAVTAALAQDGSPASFLLVTDDYLGALGHATFFAVYSYR